MSIISLEKFPIYCLNWRLKQIDFLQYKIVADVDSSAQRNWSIDKIYLALKNF